MNVTMDAIVQVSLLQTMKYGICFVTFRNGELRILANMNYRNCWKGALKLKGENDLETTTPNKQDAD